MDVQTLLHGKKLLAVDDEADVLEIFKEVICADGRAASEAKLVTRDV